MLNKILFFATLSLASVSLYADNARLSQAIQEQIDSASDCEIIAYGVELKHSDADEIFKDCVERRAILIGMQKRYGPGNYGEIDVFDKIEGYSHLVNSGNSLVRKEATSYATAAGPDEGESDPMVETIEPTLETMETLKKELNPNELTE